MIDQAKYNRLEIEARWSGYAEALADLVESLDVEPEVQAVVKRAVAELLDDRLGEEAEGLLAQIYGESYEEVKGCKEV